MAVHAQMRCHHIQDVRDAGGALLGRVVHMHAVYSDDPNHENYTWSAATPGAQLTVIVSNPTAFEEFDLGKDYNLTFKPRH